MTHKEKHNLKIIAVILTIIIAGSTAIYAFASTYSNASVFSNKGTNPPGTAYCPATGTSTAGNAPPLGCMSVPMTATITLQDLYGQSALLSNWECQIISNGGLYNPQPQGYVYESVTSSSGVCTGTYKYNPGASLLLHVCHDTSACGSTDYAQQKTNLEMPFPGYNGGPGGTFPFYQGNQAPTSTYAQTFTVPIGILAGDKAASNTPINSIVTLGNGTSIATGLTCYLNLAKGTQPCYFGTTYQPTINFALFNTLTCAANTPCGDTFNGFYPIQLQSPQSAVGTLTGAALQIEIKQTGGSDPIPVPATVFSKVVAKQGSVPDVIWATGDLTQSLSIARDQNGNLLPGFAGTYQTFQVTYNSAGMTSGSDTATVTFNLYTYWSLSYWQTNGSINTQAVTQMTQFVVTFHG